MTTKSLSKKDSGAQAAAQSTGLKVSRKPPAKRQASRAKAETNASPDPLGTVNEERGTTAHSELDRPVDQDFTSIQDTDVHGSVHSSHDAEDMDQEDVHMFMDDGFSTPKNLDAPAPRDGMDQRWIRCETRTDKDHMNLQRQMKNGWVARPLESISSSWQQISHHASGSDGLYVDGMLLCERPKALGARQKAQVQARLKKQRQYVSGQVAGQNAQNAHANMPFDFVEQRETTRGRRPTVMDD